MNVSTHQNQLISDIGVALEKQKDELVLSFISILAKALQLYKSKKFEFWVQALENTSLEQLPLSKYGYQNAARIFRSLVKHHVSAFPNGITFSSAERISSNMG